MGDAVDQLVDVNNNAATRVVPPDAQMVTKCTSCKSFDLLGASPSQSHINMSAPPQSSRLSAETGRYLDLSIKWVRTEISVVRTAPVVSPFGVMGRFDP